MTSFHDNREHGPDSVADAVEDDTGTIQLYQAQGMVMMQLQVSLDEAMTHLETYARSERRSLGALCRDVVDRKLVFGDHASR